MPRTVVRSGAFAAVLHFQIADHRQAIYLPPQDRHQFLTTRGALWYDINFDIDRGYALVANIVAPASNHPPGYPNYTIYHYFTVIGYNSDNQQVLIADSAGFAPTGTYCLSFDQLATLIPPKGYSA